MIFEMIALTMIANTEVNITKSGVYLLAVKNTKIIETKEDNIIIQYITLSRVEVTFSN